MIVTAQSYSDQVIKFKTTMSTSLFNAYVLQDFESFNIPVKQSFDFSPVQTMKEDNVKNIESSNQERWVNLKNLLVATHFNKT